ncbi:MAG TPA: peptidyl-prolyl cis-trans isomerase, partial [Pyrinomonadaceae bacterium]|nr:peptidyl-prolyl cis-trans isomerase [Pyrinomonadaceae bacterium]
FCAILLIGLIAFYIPTTQSGLTSRAANSDDDVVIAKVGSQQIKLKEYRAQLAQMSSVFGRGNPLPMSTLKAIGMDKQALDQLISNRLALDAGDKLGLTGSNGEINDLIKRQFSDANGNFVGRDEYIHRLRMQGVDVSEFEQDRRNEVTTRKVRSYLTSAEQISDREIEDKYKKDNTKIELVYALVDLEKVRSKYKLEESELKAYYDAHTADFKATQPTRKVEYVFVATKDVEKIVNIPDTELKAQYEANKQKEKRASIIRLDVLATADEDTVNAKAQELVKRARGGGPNAPAEDFATLAKGNSQDTATKDKGGDIGWVKKDTNKTGNWRQRVYTNDIKVGDVDGPFRDGQSWYIMKVTEERDVPFEQMKPTLLATAKNNKAFGEANRLAQKVYEKATEVKDLAEGAKSVAAELKITPPIKTTPYFKDGDSLPELGDSKSLASNPAFDGAVSGLKKGEIGQPVSIPGGYAVPKVVDILENGTQMTFEQARNQVEDKLRREKEPNLAKSRAQDLVNQAKSAADLERLMKADGLDVKTDTNFNTYQFPGAAGNGLQAQNQAHAAMYNLKEGEVCKTPVKVGSAYLIFGATKRTEADLSKLAADREGIRQGLLSERQNAAYDAFIKDARKRYEADGKIKIYQDQIDKFFSKAEAATQQ